MKRIFAGTVLVILFILPAEAQKVFIEHAIKAGDLWCYPVDGDTNAYKYLSSNLDISYVDNKPEFSYMRFKYDVQSFTDGNAKGGAIMHFLIKYNTPAKTIETARKILAELTGNKNVKLLGPIVYDKANFFLVSSILKGSDVQLNVLASGSAPVLEGSKIPFSFELDKDKSALMLKSFEMATSDLSIVFDLQFSGLTDNYVGKVTINWDNFYTSHGTDSKVSGSYAGIIGGSVSVKTQTEKLISNKTIEVEVKGSNPTLETQFNIAYTKIVDLLFEKTAISSDAPAEGNPLAGLMSMASASQGQANFVEASFVYSYRKFNQRGKGILNFKGRSVANMSHVLTFNFRNFYKKYGSDKGIFREVVIDDNFFKTKQIAIVPDISIVRELDSLISNVTVTIRKIHQNRDTTYKVEGINSTTLGRYDKPVYVEYANKQDRDIQKWHYYDYRYKMDLAGGGKYESDWIKTDAFQINVQCPYIRQDVRLSGDPDTLKAAGVRRIYCELTYTNFKSNKLLMSVDLTRGESPYDIKRQVILKAGEYSKSYKITWEFKDRTTKTYEHSTDADIIPVEIN